MAMYAVVNVAKIVTGVFVFFGSTDWPAEPQDEAAAVAIVQQWNATGGNPIELEEGGLIVKTRKNAATTHYRGKYAGPGDTWSEGLGLFVPPKPYPSWTLDVPTDTWVAPIPYPNDGNTYVWNEEGQTWQLAPPL